MKEVRLIDANALKEEVNKKNVVGRFNTLLLIDNAPTVCGNNPKWCESCVSKGKCASTRPQGDLISRSELKKMINDFYDSHFIGFVPNELITYANAVDTAIDNATTVELDERVIQKVLNKRCMTAVANEYLIALQGTRARGEWNYIQADMCVCPFCGAMPHKLYKNYCANCGADMRKGDTE